MGKKEQYNNSAPLAWALVIVLLIIATFVVWKLDATQKDLAYAQNQVMNGAQHSVWEELNYEKQYKNVAELSCNTSYNTITNTNPTPFYVYEQNGGCTPESSPIHFGYCNTTKDGKTYCYIFPTCEELIKLGCDLYKSCYIYDEGNGTYIGIVRAKQ